MIHGEGIVMRLLDKGAHGLRPRQTSACCRTSTRRFSELIDLPHGIVLVTGPTGSGKTTTLYSALNEIKDETTKIITIEDPVEYQLEGINQIQVHPKIGLTFAALAAQSSCVTTRTSSWSAKSATWRRPRTRSRRRSPATWCSARCTPTTPPAPSRG